MLRLTDLVLLRCFAEEDVDPVERNRAAPDHEASGDGPPENVGPGKLPDSEK